MHCVSIRSIAFKSFKTWFWNLSLSIESVDYGVWSVVPLCRSSSKRDCSNLMKLVPGVSTTSMKEVIILHCRVVYQSNVLLGHWAWLGMQSSSDYGFCGVVVRCRGGREEEEGEIKSPQVKKKRRNISSCRFLPLPSFSLTNGFHFVVHLFNKTLQML